MLGLHVHADATAAIGMASRRGVGKVRHLDTTHLRLQERVRSNDFKLSKVAGRDNMGDAFTKYVDRATLMRHMENINVCYEDGRAAEAPSINAMHMHQVMQLGAEDAHDLVPHLV